MIKHTAHINAKWRKSAKAFFDHLFMCPHCRARINAYCEEGGRLRNAYINEVKNERNE